MLDPFSRLRGPPAPYRPSLRIPFYSNYRGLASTKAKQLVKFNPAVPANKVCRLKPRDSSGAVLGRCPDLYGFRGLLRGRVVRWRTHSILSPLPHCLWWLLGYRRTRASARLSPPAVSGIPPVLPASACRFLLRPPRRPSLPRPAPPRPRVWPARGPASLESPHPGVWLHEAGEEGRAREVPSAPAAPGPREKVRNSGCASSAGPSSLGPPPPGPPGLLCGSSGAAGARTPGVRAAWGRGSRASVVGGGGGRARPVGRVSQLSAGVGRCCWGGSGRTSVLWPLGEAPAPFRTPATKQSRVCVKFGGLRRRLAALLPPPPPLGV